MSLAVDASISFNDRVLSRGIVDSSSGHPHRDGISLCGCRPGAEACVNTATGQPVKVMPRVTVGP